MNEVLRRLAKGGASSLEVLNLQGNELGGTISSDIEILIKLKTLDLSGMGLGGKIFRTQHTRVVFFATNILMFRCRPPTS